MNLAPLAQHQGTTEIYFGAAQPPEALVYGSQLLSAGDIRPLAVLSVSKLSKLDHRNIMEITATSETMPLAAPRHRFGESVVPVPVRYQDLLLQIK